MDSKIDMVYRLKNTLKISKNIIHFLEFGFRLDTFSDAKRICELEEVDYVIIVYPTLLETSFFYHSKRYRDDRTQLTMVTKLVPVLYKIFVSCRFDGQLHFLIELIGFKVYINVIY